MKKVLCILTSKKNGSKGNFKDIIVTLVVHWRVKLSPVKTTIINVEFKIVSYYYAQNLKIKYRLLNV